MAAQKDLKSVLLKIKLGDSETMSRITNDVLTVADSDETVLIEGRPAQGNVIQQS